MVPVVICASAVADAMSMAAAIAKVRTTPLTLMTPPPKNAPWNAVWLRCNRFRGILACTRPAGGGGAAVGLTPGGRSGPGGGRGRGSHRQLVLEGHRFGRARVAAEDLQQQTHAALADFPHRLRDGRQRWIEIPRKADVVEAHHREVLGHPDTTPARRLHHADRHLIVETEHRGR